MSDVNDPRPKRKAKAAATRQRIIEAATVEFTTNGYHGTAMSTIAVRAGVAVQTVYFVFHTKPELFAAALDAAVLGPEAKPPLDQRWAREASSTPVDPLMALESFIRGSADILQRAAGLSAVASAAAPTEPDLAELYRSRERLRVDGYRAFLAGLGLPTGTLDPRAADILITLLSAQVYCALRDDRGWSHEDIIEWMASSIPQLMVAKP